MRTQLVTSLGLHFVQGVRFPSLPLVCSWEPLLPPIWFCKSSSCAAASPSWDPSSLPACEFYCCHLHHTSCVVTASILQDLLLAPPPKIRKHRILLRKSVITTTSSRHPPSLPPYKIRRHLLCGPCMNFPLQPLFGSCATSAATALVLLRTLHGVGVATNGDRLLPPPWGSSLGMSAFGRWGREQGISHRARKGAPLVEFVPRFEGCKLWQGGKCSIL